MLILILKSPKLLLDLAIFASLSLAAQLLFSKTIAPLVLDRSKIFIDFLSDSMHLLDEGNWDLNCLILHIQT